MLFLDWFDFMPKSFICPKIYKIRRGQFHLQQVKGNIFVFITSVNVTNFSWDFEIRSKV
jgi:hypothetical protein